MDKTIRPSSPLQAAFIALAASTLAACTSVPLGPLPPVQNATPGTLTPPSPPPMVAPPNVPPPPVASARFIRPANGPIVQRYDGNQFKGIDIAGNVGDPIYAVADGRVVYVGGELRGYGNMVIVKHDDVFLTAYAHNNTMLVKENDVVRQGQQIATMGNSGASRVMLHFEIREMGKPVDPEPYLNGTKR